MIHTLALVVTTENKSRTNGCNYGVVARVGVVMIDCEGEECVELENMTQTFGRMIVVVVGGVLCVPVY